MNRILFLVAGMGILIVALAGCFAATPTPASVGEISSSSGEENAVAGGNIADTSQTPEPMSERICLVTAPNLNLRSGPSIESSRVGALPKGAQFVVSGGNGAETWYYGVQSGVSGWASSNYLDCYRDASSLPTEEVSPPDATVTPVAKTDLAIGSSTVTLVEPLEGTLFGRRVFRWAGSVDMQPGQMYELVFWPAGGDPMVDGFGPVGAQPANEVTVDLGATADHLAQFMYGRDYEWGILLVSTEPYQRIRYLGGGHPFRLRTVEQSPLVLPVVTGQPFGSSYPED